MNIVENSKLIDEFMGVEPMKIGNSYSLSDSPFWYCTQETREKVLEAHANYAKYHTSWDWLMPVVEKIESIKGTQIFINGISCEIIFKGKVITKHFNSKIEAAYNACIEFIHWYNEQNK